MSFNLQNASFRIDGMDTMVMGLPPPEVHNMQSFRNFGLAYSIREVFISVSVLHTVYLPHLSVESDMSELSFCQTEDWRDNRSTLAQTVSFSIPAPSHLLI